MTVMTWHSPAVPHGRKCLSAWRRELSQSLPTPPSSTRANMALGPHTHHTAGWWCQNKMCSTIWRLHILDALRGRETTKLAYTYIFVTCNSLAAKYTRARCHIKTSSGVREWMGGEVWLWHYVHELVLTHELRDNMNRQSISDPLLLPHPGRWENGLVGRKLQETPGKFGWCEELRPCPPERKGSCQENDKERLLMYIRPVSMVTESFCRVSWRGFTDYPVYFMNGLQTVIIFIQLWYIFSRYLIIFWQEYSCRL